MDGKIKTGREAFGFRHQLTAERQGLFPFTRRENRVRVLPAGNVRAVPGFSHTHRAYVAQKEPMTQKLNLKSSEHVHILPA